MPQDSSAVRPINGLYLYLYLLCKTYQILRVRRILFH